MDAMPANVRLFFTFLSCQCVVRESARPESYIHVNDPRAHGENLRCQDLFSSPRSFSGFSLPPYRVEYLRSPRQTQNISVLSSMDTKLPPFTNRPSTGNASVACTIISRSVATLLSIPMVRNRQQIHKLPPMQILSPRVGLRNGGWGGPTEMLLTLRISPARKSASSYIHFSCLRVRSRYA